jgi:hypothetical protein
MNSHIQVQFNMRPSAFLPGGRPPNARGNRVLPAVAVLIASAALSFQFSLSINDHPVAPPMPIWQGLTAALLLSPRCNLQ